MLSFKELKKEEATLENAEEVLALVEELIDIKMQEDINKGEEQCQIEFYMDGHNWSDLSASIMLKEAFETVVTNKRGKELLDKLTTDSYNLEKYKAKDIFPYIKRLLYKYRANNSVTIYENVRGYYEVIIY
jgi:hypothetical protein